MTRAGTGTKGGRGGFEKGEPFVPGSSLEERTEDVRPTSSTGDASDPPDIRKRIPFVLDHVTVAEEPGAARPSPFPAEDGGIGQAPPRRRMVFQPRVRTVETRHEPTSIRPNARATCRQPPT